MNTALLRDLSSVRQIHKGSKEKAEQKESFMVGEQTMDMYKRDIIKLAKKLGIENRIDQTQEECAELIQALSKYRRTVVQKDKTCSVDELKARNMVTEEIADVEFCLTQIKKLLSISDMEIEGIKSVKVTRTKKRMECK